jgi:hypothetical protein
MNGGLAYESPVRPTIVPAVTQILPWVQEIAPPAKYRGKFGELLFGGRTRSSANTSAERRNSPPGTSGNDSPPLKVGKNGFGSGG